MKVSMHLGSTRGGASFGIWVVSVWIYLATQHVAADIPVKLEQACGPSTSNLTVTVSSGTTLLFFLPSSMPPSSQCLCSITTEAATSYSSVELLKGVGKVTISSKIDTGSRGNQDNATSGSAPAPSFNSSLPSSSSSSSSPATSTTSFTANTTRNKDHTTSSSNLSPTTTTSNISSSSPTTPSSNISIATNTTDGPHDGGADSKEKAGEGGSGDKWCKWKEDRQNETGTGCPRQASTDGDKLMILLEGQKDSSIVFLVVNANSSVNISCETSVPTVSSTTQLAGTQITPKSGSNPLPASTSTQSIVVGVSSSDAAVPRSSDKADGLSTSGSGSDTGEDDDSKKTSQMMLALGCALVVIAVIIVIAVALNARRGRRKQSGGHVESGQGKKRQRGSKPPSSNGATVSGAGLNNSRVSLISEGGHNYEDMREDEAADSLRKASHFSVASSTSQRQQLLQQNQQRKKHSHPQPDNYSHIPGSRPPPPLATGDGGDDSDDDYSRLDLAPRVSIDTCRKTTPTVSSPPPSSAPNAEAASAAPKKFCVGDEDNEYTEVRDEGDIYEAVDEAVHDDVYTDCASSSNVTSAKVGDGGKVNPAFDKKGLVLKPGQSSSPAVPLPAATAKGLRRHKSRSVDISKVEALRYKAAAAAAAAGGGGGGDRAERGSGGEGWGGKKGHKHSRSADFNSSSTNPFHCQERDLFLENFKKEQAEGGGGGGGSAAAGSQQAGTQQPAEYTDVRIVGETAEERIAMPPPTTSSPSALKNNNAATSNSGAATSPEGAAAGPTTEPGVVLRRKTHRRSPSKKKLDADRPVSMIDHLKEINSQVLQLETAVRRSMEIHEDEFVMIDNAIYGTLPRNNSLPTTEL